MITSQPAATVTAGSGFGFTVTAEDAEGNMATGFTGSETVGLGSNPGSQHLGRHADDLGHSGVATFAGLTLEQGRQRLHVGCHERHVDRGHQQCDLGHARHGDAMLITTSRLDRHGGQRVWFHRHGGRRRGKRGHRLQRQRDGGLGSNPGGSTLGGTLTVSATSGVAAFSGVNLNKAGSGYTLAVTSGTLTAATSSAISVTPAPLRSWSCRLLPRVYRRQRFG